MRLRYHCHNAPVVDERWGGTMHKAVFFAVLVLGGWPMPVTAVPSSRAQSAFAACDAAVLKELTETSEADEATVVVAKAVTDDAPNNYIEICYETRRYQRGLVLIFARCPLDEYLSVKFVQMLDERDSISYCRSTERWPAETERPHR